MDQSILFRSIMQSWSRETSSDSNGWTEQIPSWGQCAVTALVVQDFLKGDLARLDISDHKDPKVSAMRSHYFGLVDGAEVDISSGQFGDINRWGMYISGKERSKRSREYLLSNTETSRRYARLRFEVARRLCGNNPLFDDPIYLACLLSAATSNCQKSHFGSVVRLKDTKCFLATGANRIIDCNKSWTEPECIRINIQSRTESMIGCCAHAEEMALVGARNIKADLKECELYVAGYTAEGFVNIPQEKRFTCIRCATQMYLHGVGKLFVPCKDHWAALTMEEAMESAKKYALGEKKV